MKDIRISVRLTKEEHIKFKTIAIKVGKSMQELLKDYVRNEIEQKGVTNEKKN